jgi:PleD family two-component response regulator
MSFTIPEKHITVSIRLSCSCPSLDTPEKFVEASDMALYEAKGRDATG